jgi:hypothetical protein
MHVQDYLVRERQQERLRQAEDGRAGHQVTELRRLERRRERAERQLLRARQRVEQFRALLSEG